VANTVDARDAIDVAESLKSSGAVNKSSRSKKPQSSGSGCHQVIGEEVAKPLSAAEGAPLK
jgi:hypothetical protein